MKIKVGEIVSWQRSHNNPYTGQVLAFCPKGTPIADAIDLSTPLPNYDESIPNVTLSIGT